MDCLFCKIIKGEIPSYKIYENDYVFCFLDIHPNNVGHTLVVPKKHIKNAYEIDNETYSHINEGIKEVLSILDKTFKPDGYKIVNNVGICQDVLHFHTHVIPKYKSEPMIDSIENVYNKIENNC